MARWVLATLIGLLLVTPGFLLDARGVGESFVGYRVREVLTTVGAFTPSAARRR